MESDPMPDDLLPFFYLTNPVYNAIYRHLGCVIFFHQPVTPEQHDELETHLPFPFQHERIWSQRFLFVGTADWLNADVREGYNPTIAKYLASQDPGPDTHQRLDTVMQAFDLDPTPEEIHDFSQAMDRWFHHLHPIAPVAFIYMTDSVELDRYRHQAQHDLPLIPEKILPFLATIWNGEEVTQKKLHHGLPGMLELVSQSVVKLYLHHHSPPSSQAIASIETFSKTVQACHKDYPLRFWTHHLAQQLASFSSS